MSTTTSSMKPQITSTPMEWLRRNLFNSWLNSIITLVLVIVIPVLLYDALRWIILDATWTPVAANFRLLMVGRYPPEQVWRVQLAVAIIYTLFGLSAGIWRGGILQAIAIGLGAGALVLALLPFSMAARLWLVGWLLLIGAGFAIGMRLPSQLRLPVIIGWLLSPVLAVLLIRGVAGMLLVETGLWGGLMLTILLAVVGVVASFPLGVLLALGRRSKLPVIRIFCTIYIEIVRGVPLVSVLFMSALMLPYFLPASFRVDNLVRAMVAITLFSAAYLAENVRGGLQAVPKGQSEAADALGLNFVQTTFLIVMPQALRAVIPALVGQFISLFKDTSLVSIVGIAELLGIAGVVINQPEWLTVPGGVEKEVLLFVALIYWIFCFSLSKISRRIEANLGVGTR